MAEKGDDFMIKTQIQAIQERIGVNPDGDFGPVSREACRNHLLALMPDPYPWPSSRDDALTAFYGKAGDESNLVNLPVVGLGVKYDGAVVKSVRCHKRVAASLLTALEEIAAGPCALILSQYAGCYNYRNMRGGTRQSKHSWGVAIDLAPQTNTLYRSWPNEATMPFEVMESFARQGWTSAGAFWNRDAMHFEACHP